MSYLYPPPQPAPVIITKDVGGLVSDYRERTEQFRAERRDVRLHECRSACTLALSLPNVCVFPDSLLKFHQAYNDITKETDLGISDELWRSYPAPVRARLGTLTRQYKVMRGTELIALGIRDCSAPAEKILIAKARPVPQPQTETGTMLAGLGSALTSVLGSAPTTVVQTTPVAASAKPTQPPVEPAPPSPEPRPRSELSPPVGSPVDVPLPPIRPPLVARARFPEPAFRRPIAGSQPILPPRFAALASLR